MDAPSFRSPPRAEPGLAGQARQGPAGQARPGLAGGLVPRHEPAVACRPAASAAELAAHYAIRHEVFVREQGIFAADDRDRHDGEPDVLHVVGLVEGVVRGTVRLYPVDLAAGQWKGDRLAVATGFRRHGHGLGAALVRFAVSAAGRRGGREMVAFIQPGNVRFFENLGWHQVGEAENYVGRPHHRMVIALDPSAGR